MSSSPEIWDLGTPPGVFEAAEHDGGPVEASTPRVWAVEPVEVEFPGTPDNSWRSRDDDSRQRVNVIEISSDAPQEEASDLSEMYLMVNP